MNKRFILLAIFFGICSSVLAMAEIAIDSIGVNEVDGKVFIVHKVEAGETLYALSRRYHVSVQLIRQANQEDVSSLDIGQLVLIPSLNQPSNSSDIIHTVRSSETLFSISKTYNVTVDELRSWNNISDNTISVGQKLVIRKEEKTADINQPVTETGPKTHTVRQDETIYSISRRYDISAQELRSLNKLSSNSLNVGQVLVLPDGVSMEHESASSNSSMLPTTVKEEEPTLVTADAESETAIEVVTSTESNDRNDDVVSPPEQRPIEKIVQKGMAEVNEQRSETKKYLGLHRDAPIGTIMQVRNEMNNQSVFVRIVGTIPDTGDNAKVILKISQKAYDRLGAVDSRFPVEISYMP